MISTRTLKPLVTILGLCTAARAANAQRGTVSDFSGASVASSAFIGAFHPQPAGQAPNPAVSVFAVHAMALRLGTALNGGTVAGGGLTTSAVGVQVLGRLLAGPATAVAVERQKVAAALRPSGAFAAQIDRLLTSLTGLLATPAAIPDAAAAFHDFVNSSSAEYLSHPPAEFRAIYSTLFELICSESVSTGVTAPQCAPPDYVIDQPPSVPLINQDSIDAAARAAVAKARLDSAAAAAARAHADSVAATTRAAETARARAVLETAVYFDPDQFALRENARASLDAKLPILRANPDVRIRIEGNIDARESGDFNNALGKLRAEQARSYLIAHGIGYSRIDIVDHGATRAVCAERRESCWQRNRRDEFIIVAGGAQMRWPD